MGLDLWFQEDVARILASTQEAMRCSAGAVGAGDAYRRGVEDALRAVGLAFGLPVPGRVGVGQVRASREVVEGESVARPVGSWEREGWR
jgi:hypothetical protein